MEKQLMEAIRKFEEGRSQTTAGRARSPHWFTRVKEEQHRRANVGRDGSSSRVNETQHEEQESLHEKQCPKKVPTHTHVRQTQALEHGGKRRQDSGKDARNTTKRSTNGRTQYLETHTHTRRQRKTKIQIQALSVNIHCSAEGRE